MIFANDCWLQSTCKKYQAGQCDNLFCIKEYKLDYLYNNSLLSNKQRQHINLRLDSNQSDKQAFCRLKYIEENIESFVKNGNNLYIYSHICGNGKTAWAIRLIQAYFNAIWHKTDLTCRALFINVPKFLLQLKDSLSNKNEYIQFIKDNILVADIVVWDEIGSKLGTEFEIENLLSLINNRIDNNKCNIYTSNLSAQQLYEKLGQRLHSRIINLSECIEFIGSDKRKLNVQKDDNK